MPEIISTLSTILGLLSIFKAERRDTSDNEFDDFLVWLVHKQHKVVVDEINTNHQLSLSIKMLLTQNHEKAVEILRSVDSSLTLLSSKIDGIREISHAINPNLELSNQAISILQQLKESGGSHFVEIKRGLSGGVFLMLVDKKGKIEANETQFLNDDLQQLVDLNLLIEGVNSANNRTFSITRIVVKYLEQVNKS